MKVMRTVGLLFLLVGNSHAFAGTDVKHVNKYILSFTEEDAKAWSKAFGLTDRLNGSFAISPVAGLSLSGSVTGSTGGNGESNYHYTGRLDIDAKTFKLREITGIVAVVLGPDDARKMFDAMKSATQTTTVDGDIKTLLRTIPLEDVDFECSYTARGFLPYKCNIVFTVPSEDDNAK